MKCTESQTKETFTDDELYIISDAMLNLIRSTNCALKLIYDQNSIESLGKSLKKYKEVNQKVCMMLK